MRSIICKTFVFAGALVLAEPTHSAPETPADGNRKLIGLEIETAEPDNAATAALIEEAVRNRLRELEGWPGFSALKDQSAIAVDLDIRSEVSLYDGAGIHVSYWGGGWEYDSLDTARTSALANCKGSCRIIIENGSFVGMTELVRAYQAAAAEARKTAESALAAADKVFLLENALSKAAKDPRAPKGAAALPGDYLIGYPDQQQDYASACQGRVRYALTPALQDGSKATHSRLRSLEAKGLYAPYVRSLDTILDFDKPDPQRLMTRMMRFTVKAPEGMIAREKLPANLLKALDDKSIDELWLEGSARVTEEGQVLAVESTFRPLALRTGTDFLQGVEVRLPDPGFYCYVGMPFKNEVVRFATSKNDVGKVKQIVETMLNALKVTFSRKPIGASTSANADLHPGELALTRNDARSMVLGGPNHERSSYFAEIDVAESENPWYSLYGRSRFRGGRSAMSRSIDGKSSELRAYLQLRHTFTRARHRLGDYRDPSQDEVERYSSAIRMQTQSAVQLACAHLGGLLQSGVCVVK